VSKIVPFQPKNMPAKPVVYSPEGRTMLIFTCSFYHNGREISFDLAAHSLADAEHRLASLRSTVIVTGELEAAGEINFVPWVEI